MAGISNKAKAMSSVSHISRSHSTGDSGERRFYDSCKAAGLSIKKTPSRKDMYEHTDFMVDGKSFDVKGLKQSQKHGDILLEIKNVQGKKGWCNADDTPQWVAFDFGGFFLCVKNADLYKTVGKICNIKDAVKKIGEAKYKGYTRRNREDLMTLITLHDAMTYCEYWILPQEDHHQPMDLL